MVLGAGEPVIRTPDQRLRVFVSSEACGGWQPVPIRVGSRSVDALAIHEVGGRALAWAERYRCDRDVGGRGRLVRGGSRGRGEERVAIIAPMMSDRPVEIRIELLMGRSQHEQVASRFEQPGGTLQLPSIVDDVLQNVNVDDRVEPIP